MFKKQLTMLQVVLLVAIVSTLATLGTAKFANYLYGDALIIENSAHSTLASIDTDGRLDVTYINIPAMSSTTLATYTPEVGEVVYNSTRHAICVATSTTAGALIFQSSNPITTAGVSCKE